jgi:hypothetical protein
VALLGIGSGINSLMIGLDWQRTPAQPRTALAPPHFAQVAGTLRVPSP